MEITTVNSTISSFRWLTIFAACTMIGIAQTPFPVVPKDKRGHHDYEREGTHDANNIRTLFKNFGMVGSYPDNPIGVDLSTFHSAESPKGSGMNYSDGITPFILAKVMQNNTEYAYIMETGFRERQQLSPKTQRIMKFEPRPGYMQLDPAINRDRSPAVSNLERTWPSEWIDKLNDAIDPGWKGSWNGYFGKKPAADQESFFVMDDDYFDAWDFYPDSLRDKTRRGLGMKIEVRGFQWSNPQAGNVIFWHYDISNEGTTDYFNNIIFGLYMDSGVGGSTTSCDPLPESDDDNAFYDKSLGLNLVYTWDTYGHGRSLSSSCGPTGYLGYAYLETPGKPSDAADNDNDGIVDEKRDANTGVRLVGQQAIMNYVNANYNVAKFETIYGSVTERPAYKAGVWWTGDEDMDWIADFNDTGADGVFGTSDKVTDGEEDGIPTQGETNFGQTDLHESDQIGLTGFKFNRIRAGDSNPGGATDGIVFFNNGQKHWPKLLYDQFIGDAGANPFDAPLTLDYNIAFLFASGTFTLPVGARERFSLALAYGSTLSDLKRTTAIVQQIYNANYQFATPPPAPTVTAESGDGYVRLSWDDASERALDPVTYKNDFEGYRIYRATDPEFRDVKVISNAQGTGPMVYGRPLVQYDIVDSIQGYSKISVDGVQYYLGDETGIRHTFKDTTVINGQVYYYAVCAYDYGSDSIGFFPSENAITVSHTVRGGIILPKNVVEVRPEPKVTGFVPAQTSAVAHVKGKGNGTVSMEIVNTNLVPDNRVVKLKFYNDLGSLAIRPEYYELSDSASGKIYIDRGTSFDGLGTGQVGIGIKPVVKSEDAPVIDSSATGFAAYADSLMKMRYKFEQTSTMSKQKRHYGYPNDLQILYGSSILDTSYAYDSQRKKIPTKFSVRAILDDGSTQRMSFTFRDLNNDSTLSTKGEFINVLDTSTIELVPGIPSTKRPDIIWTFEVDSFKVMPAAGDLYTLKLKLPITTADEYSFITKAQYVDNAKSKKDFEREPYVVPNPYVGANSIEPERFAISGRGERRMEFRGLPSQSVIRIYTVSGTLVRTLRHDGSNDGFVPWDLRTKDNMDVAPGLYIYQVDGHASGTFIGKFAIIK